MKKQAVRVQLSTCVQPCDVWLVRHRNGTESVFCSTVLENGKVCTLEAKCTPLKKEGVKHSWDVTCLGMETYSSDAERWSVCVRMHRFWLESFTGMIDDDKRAERERFQEEQTSKWRELALAG